VVMDSGGVEKNLLLQPMNNSNFDLLLLLTRPTNDIINQKALVCTKSSALYSWECVLAFVHMYEQLFLLLIPFLPGAMDGNWKEGILDMDFLSVIGGKEGRNLRQDLEESMDAIWREAMKSLRKRSERKGWFSRRMAGPFEQH